MVKHLINDNNVCVSFPTVCGIKGTFYIKFEHNLCIPYSGKVWQWESLAKLADLAKLQAIRQLKPAKF